MARAAAPIVHVVVAGEVGGAERMVLALARARRGSASRRHLIALWTDDAAVSALFTDADVEVVRSPRPGGLGVAPALPRGTIGGGDVDWLAALLLQTGAAAVQLHTFASHVLGTRAGARADVPVIRTEHSTRVYDNWLCRPFSRWAVRRAAAIVAVSDHLRRRVVASLPEAGPRVRVIRNGVAWTPSPPPPPPSGGPLRLALCARLEPRKGVDRALLALSQLGASAYLELDIVGDGPSRRALEHQALALGIRDRVRFWGYRADPERIVAQTDAVLCSSRTEGMPVALLEGMALGRPVIGVPVGGVPEIVTDGDTGWLAGESSVAALAATLARAARAGRVEMARRGARARAHVERNLTEAHMRAAYEALYASLEPAAMTVGHAPAARSAG